MSLFLPRLLPVLLTLGLIAPVLPAMAQSTATAPATGPARVVDETALRYFARQGDERRLQAEIARLAAIYPGWVPPEDPLAVDSNVDPLIQQLWDLYGVGDLAQIQSLIAQRTTSDPAWRPPVELSDALTTAATGAEMRRLSAAGENEPLIALAATHPELLTCQNIDLLWSVGEAFAETSREGRALDAYSYILKTCDNDRLATMQKAEGLFDETDVATLLTLERTTPDGAGEFGAIELDLARRRVADVLNGVVRRADPAALAEVEAAAEADKKPDDLRLLGYYELSLNRNRQARDWFEAAYEVEPSPASAEGLAIALLRQNDGLAAEALLVDLLGETEALDELYLSAASQILAGDPPRRIEPEVLERIISATTETRNARVAQDLGWYAYGFGQTQTAVQWFEESLGYDPAFEPAAYGLLVASQKLRDRTTMRQIMEQWGPISPRIRLFGQPNAPTTAPTRFELDTQGALLHQALYRMDNQPAFMLVAELTPSQRQAMQQCNDFVPPESLSASAALSRGWCLLDIGRNAESEAAFRVATLSASTSIRTDAYYGHTLAALRLGLVDDAAISASAMPQTAERVQTMQVALLSTTATVYYQIGRYHDVLALLDQRRALAPEENGLLTIRAWSYYHLNRLREAKQIFTAVAATGYQDAQRGLEALAARGY